MKEEEVGEGRLTLAQKAELLEGARRSLKELFGIEAPHPPSRRDPALERMSAAFVTLTRKGKLRGCIGYSEALYPLREAVARCAVAAATQDYRFAPVTQNELAEIDISISALTPLRALERTDDLVPGRHGLMIVSEGHRGLLLPQVASEHGWDRVTFLRETCRKAGLGPDVWKQAGTDVYVFEADVFSEEDVEPSRRSPSR